MGKPGPCSVKGCPGEGLWIPTIILPPIPGEEKSAGSAEIQLKICTHHKNNIDHKDYVDRWQVYDILSSYYRSVGLEPPPKEEVKVVFQRAHPEIIIVDDFKM